MIQDEQKFQCVCECGCTTALLVSWDEFGDEPAWTSVEFYEHVGTPHSRRERAKLAISMLRGKFPFTHGLVLSKDEAIEMGKFLSKS